jgi:hypothetical protein
MAICKYDNQRPANLCGQNTEYITRLSKVAKIHFHNLPKFENELAPDDLQSRRDAAMAYGEVRELESRKNQRIKNSKTRIDRNGCKVPMRQDRNHQTLIISWDRTEDPTKAARMTKEFLEDKFPDARCIYTVHTDKKGQTHTHAWVDTKLENGKRLQIQPKTFYNFDSAWAQKYDAEYGTSYAPVFKERSDQTREWNKRKAAAKEAGRTFDEPKPLRYGDIIKAKFKENMRARDLNNAGVTKHYDQSRDDGDKRVVTAGRSGIDDSKRAIERSQQSVEQRITSADRTKQSIDTGKQRATAANRNFDETVRYAKDTISRMERVNERGRGDDRDR